MKQNKVQIKHSSIRKHYFVTIFSGMLTIAFITSLAQSFSKVSAVESSSSATASVTVSSACSFSRTNSDYNETTGYTGTLSNGSDTEIIGSTFKTICNDPGGYAIYAIGYSNNTLGNTDLIFNDTPESTNNIKTNSDTLVGSNGSYWKMKLSPVSGDFAPTIENSYSSYNDVPSNYIKVASFNNVTVNSSDSTTGSSVATSYLAYASSTQPAGTYTGAVKYTMVHPSTGPAPITIDSLHYLQDFATLSILDKTDVLASMITGEQYQLLDSRDQKPYYISKLADNNVWMTQNLDLDIDETKIYTHQDTDLGYTTNDSTATWKPTEGHSTIPWDSTNNAFIGWENQAATPYSADPGEKYYYTSGTTGNDTPFDSIYTCTQANHSQADCKHYHAGNYYNWTASIASNDSSSFKSPSDAPDSICPAGWELPSNINNDFSQLLLAYNIIESANDTTYLGNGLNYLREQPLYFVRAGDILDAKNRSNKQYGFYWTKTLPSNNPARFFFNRINIYAIDSTIYKYLGYSIRCLAR